MLQEVTVEGYKEGSVRVPSIVAFEVEATEPKYEKKQALKNLHDHLKVGVQKWQNYLP
jgi:hypothetical protein